MNKDTVAGAIRETGGKIRSKVDHAVGDSKGEAQGRKDEALGKMQKNFGKMKSSLKD